MTAASAHRDFDAEPLEDLPPAATFTLGGRKWRVKAADDWPFGTAEQMFTVSEGEKVMVQIGPFFRSVLVAEDVEPFMAILTDPSQPGTLRRVTGIIEFITEEVLGFPTTRDSGSSSTSAARPRKPKSSKARSSSPATRRRASGE
jgi:hypothetical protein